MGLSTVPRTDFTTLGLPERDQFDAWRETIGVIFDVARVDESDAEGFPATLTAFQLGHLMLANSTQPALRYERSARKAHADQIDLIFISAFLEGGYDGTAGDVAIQGGRGDFQICDLARPIMTIDRPSTNVTLFLPRECIEDLLVDLDDIHGIDLGQAQTDLLRDYLSLLSNHLPRMTSLEMEDTSRATCQMVAACLRPSLQNSGAARRSIEAVLLLRAKRFIAANLQTSELSPEHICRELAISRRTLYRMFEALGGVQHYVQGRRLTKIHAALSDQSDHRHIMDIAAQFGFLCKETFWRAFRRQFGLTPGQVRGGEHRELPASQIPAEAGDRFDGWIRSLHA